MWLHPPHCAQWHSARPVTFNERHEDLVTHPGWKNEDAIGRGTTMMDVTPGLSADPAPSGYTEPKTLRSQPYATDTRPLISGRFRRIRSVTGHLAARLTPEDQMVQSAPDVSPTKWHLAHTSWFIEKHVLERFAPGYTSFDDRYAFLFNTAPEPASTCHASSARGLLSRPSHQEILRYRDHVNAAVLRLIADAPSTAWPAIAQRIELALRHEQEHQEQILTDIKHVFWSNPLQPGYQGPTLAPLQPAAGQTWFSHPGGIHDVGQDGPDLCFGIDGPRHKVHVQPFKLAGRLITNGEYLEFMEDGGYGAAGLWHPDGWAIAQREGWRSPLYWFKRGGIWHQFTLAGMRLLDEEEPVCHVSWYEAAAFARWAGRRLATETEWELMAAQHHRTGNLLEYERLHPAVGLCAGLGPWQLYGDVWEWTQSPLTPYPRWRPGDLAVGEYAGPPPAGHMVLKGGSALTPGDLVSAARRHHLPPASRRQMTGIRLADDI